MIGVDTVANRRQVDEVSDLGEAEMDSCRVGGSLLVKSPCTRQWTSSCLRYA